MGSRAHRGLRGPVARPPPRRTRRCSRPDLAELYDAFETPRSVRGEVELLDPEQARGYLRDVRARSAEALAERESATRPSMSWCCATSFSTPRPCARRWRSPSLLPVGEPRLRALGGEGTLAGDGGWIDVPAGPFEMGAGARRVRLRQRAPASLGGGSRLSDRPPPRDAMRAGGTSARTRRRDIQMPLSAT